MIGNLKVDLNSFDDIDIRVDSAGRFYREQTYRLTKKDTDLEEREEILDINIFPINAYEKNKTRRRKKKETRVSQNKLNDKRAKEYFFRKVQCNFDRTDYIWCISYTNEPKSVEEANNDFRNLFKRINRYRKKIGLGNAKYMAIREGGGEGSKKRIHFHIIIDGKIERDKLESFWKKGYSHTRRLQPDETGFKALSNYMTKGREHGKRWKLSKGNLVEPEANVNDCKFTRGKMRKMLQHNPSREELEAMYPGYCLTDYSITYNEINGGIYMKILMRRVVKNKR